MIVSTASGGSAIIREQVLLKYVAPFITFIFDLGMNGKKNLKLNGSVSFM